MYRFLSGFFLGVWVGSHTEPPAKVMGDLLDTAVKMIKDIPSPTQTPSPPVKLE